MLNDKTHFHAETPQAVRLVLESARINRQRIRIWLGDVKTGKCWNDEYDIIGRIGRSTGNSVGDYRVPIMLRNSRSSGGGAILDHCIIAVAVAPGRFNYKHPTLDLGAWTVGPPCDKDRAAGYVEASYCDGEICGQFKKPGQAARHCAFMLGTRFAK